MRLTLYKSINRRDFAGAAPTFLEPAHLPLAAVRWQMLADCVSFQHFFVKSRRTDIIHAFTLASTDQRQVFP